MVNRKSMITEPIPKEALDDEKFLESYFELINLKDSSLDNKPVETGQFLGSILADNPHLYDESTAGVLSKQRASTIKQREEAINEYTIHNLGAMLTGVSERGLVGLVLGMSANEGSGVDKAIIEVVKDYQAQEKAMKESEDGYAQSRLERLPKSSQAILAGLSKSEFAQAELRNAQYDVIGMFENEVEVEGEKRKEFDPKGAMSYVTSHFDYYKGAEDSDEKKGAYAAVGSVANTYFGIKMNAKAKAEQERQAAEQAAEETNGQSEAA